MINLYNLQNVDNWLRFIIHLPLYSDRLQEQGAAIITDQVLPAYRRLKSFINQVRKSY